MQLFIEALVLAGLAALLGLVVAKLALRWGVALLAGSDAMPFWINDSLSWETVLYTALLTLFGAAIVGILPALRVTKRNVQDALRNEGAARSGLRFGGFWTTVIVVQVAITVRIPTARGPGRIRVQSVPAKSRRHRCGAIPDRDCRHRPGKLRHGFGRVRFARAAQLE